MEQKFIKALEKEKENYITFRGLCNIIHSIFDVEEIEALYKLVQDPKFLYYLQNYPSSSNSKRKKGILKCLLMININYNKLITK